MVADARCAHDARADERRNGVQSHRFSRQRSVGEINERSVSLLASDERGMALSLIVRGPGHHLLEHPDKDGNLPLMHACAKLDIG